MAQKKMLLEINQIEVYYEAYLSILNAAKFWLSSVRMAPARLR
jgi:hypothetical protein